ncbi:hypothetical protein Lesp02_58220 [Lentzea sp. NBRC 105346]|nr:hypothetical protein Lesp02_58220 [Lentzea sp. NBRC 105346]
MVSDGGLDDLSVAAERFHSWEWLVLRSGSRLLLNTDHHVSAVELPSGIGGEVQHYLAVRMLAGPVLVLPGAPARWLILTESADDASQVNLIRLRARGALTHRRGTLVPLPPSRLERGEVTWLGHAPDENPFLPPFSAVVASVRAVTESAGIG